MAEQKPIILWSTQSFDCYEKILITLSEGNNLAWKWEDVSKKLIDLIEDQNED